MNEKLISWLKAAGISLLCYVCVSWILALKSDTNASWCWMMWFFAATYCLLNKYQEMIGYLGVLSSAIVGANLILCPALIANLPDTRMSAIFIISIVIGILLSGICHCKKNSYVFLLSIAIMILYNSFVVPAWFNNVFIN